ncbi:MAG: ABC transporter ATP-binding protein [Candidatus Omnitrophica bacterium]|nr:ABC transporter ATP-binding protein [Candidatus Omnitrophota bacterium]
MVEIENLSFAYKTRQALRGVSFQVGRGEIFGVLGPNGSGKSTLFKILSTLFSLPRQNGRVRINGLDLLQSESEIRKKIGIVFQSPSLDPKLTVRENLVHQGHLYGLSGAGLNSKIKELLVRFSLEDRSGEIVQKLSGGLKRRVEIVKGLLHQPVLLILDEPSTGLDPGTRLDLWKHLNALQAKDGVTILVTTHLMEEAEHCHRLVILSQGRVVALGSPESLKQKVGGDILLVKTQEEEDIARKIEQKFGLNTVRMNGLLQIEHKKGPGLMTQLIEAFPGKIQEITFRRPTLEDVFIHHTGHQFWKEN